MSGNSSHSFSVFEEMYSCCNSTAGAISITVFSVINITIILPLCIIVLYLGFQRWQQQTPNTPMNHCDVFTYNMILLDLLQIIGSVISSYGIHADGSGLLSAGVYLLFLYVSGQTLIFPLTCVDYYLAVVFPIVYLSLRKPKFIRARNIIIGCIWLCNTAWILSLRSLQHEQITSFVSVLNTFTLFFIIFSCFSVLHVLIRPGPSKGDKRQVDQPKLRAFYTMIAILAVLTFRFVRSTICNAIFSSREVKEAIRCAVWFSLVCHGLPCSLLQPILFLQRTGKLPFCKNNV